MTTAKQVINSTKTKRIKVPSGPTKKGSAGYDNVRDDIEKVKKVREIVTEGIIYKGTEISDTYIPYVGATKNIDLGSKSITTSATFIGDAATTSDRYEIYYKVGGLTKNLSLLFDGGSVCPDNILGDVDSLGSTANRWDDLFLSGDADITGDVTDGTNATSAAEIKAAYDHSQVAGGNSVHVSTTENTNWDTAYSHISTDGTSHSGVNGVVTIHSDVTNAGSGLIITSGEGTNLGTAYDHSQLAGGNNVHVSTTENTQWDTAYTHSQIAGGNSVHVSTTENTNWDSAHAHISANGTSHANVVLNDSHRADNSQAHSDYLLNNANDSTSGTLATAGYLVGAVVGVSGVFQSTDGKTITVTKGIITSISGGC